MAVEKLTLQQKLTAEWQWLRQKAYAQNMRMHSTLIEWSIRKASASHRTLPNCMIVGAQKAGSSSLYHYLVQHPQVHASFSKEKHYFDGGTVANLDTFAKGQPWYQAHFPLKTQVKPGDVCIDASPLYLFNPLVAQRIKAQIPHCKIIILLRNPVERAISHYYHVKRFGHEKLTLKDALAQESNRLANALNRKDYQDPAFRLYSYQARGLYLQQIALYQQHFASEQILILNSEVLFSRPEDILPRVFDFLNLDTDYQVPDLKAVNTGNNKTKIAPQDYQSLQDYFALPNQALFEHLGETYVW
ncbi:sulfotransferase family protein [Thalassomonas actiniarum]|uniref:Sulfotransferase domain-containing protein n=1 Tax=Thalassomonas actiniarum TaxID=485447 RepID=A0AAE9YUD9_9GAMM|nr:sulfotransferase [Thalassomonas actiniarum]WDE00534.1 sulfotransferase domain-containing protein [Thalassomonas actiniarum]